MIQPRKLKKQSTRANLVGKTNTKNKMKTKDKTNRILNAIAYLIDRQGLNPDQIKNLILKSIEE